MAGFELKGDDWFLDDVIHDTDFRGFSHNKEGFYVYLAKIDDEEELRSCLEDINIVFYRTEKHYEQLDTKIEELKRDLERTRKEEESRRIGFRRRSSKQVVRDIEEWTAAKKRMGKMYIGVIIYTGPLRR